MAKAILVPGTRFRLHREVDGQPDVFGYVGLATTLAFTTTLALDADTVSTCDDPDAPQPERLYVRGSSWEISFSGRVDIAAFRLIEGDQLSKNDPHRYRVIIGATGLGRSYTGKIFFEHLSRQSQDRGFVSFSAACRGHDVLTITDI